LSRVAIVLAAGRSSRFDGDKLAALLDGRSLLEHAIRTALAAPVERVIVVADEGRALPEGLPVERVGPDGPDLSDSLRAGIAAAGGADAAFIFLGDMPLVPPDLAGRLAQAIGGALAAVPVRDGQAGHPVLLASRGFDLAADIPGDRGLGQLLRDRPDVVRLAVASDGITHDIDTRTDLAAVQRIMRA